MDYASPYYNEGAKASIFYAELWLLTHYLMIGNPEAHKKLVGFLDALSRGKRPQDAAAAFGDLHKLQSELDAYGRQKRFLSITTPLPNLEKSDLHVRALSKAEVNAYAGGLSAAVGYPQQGVRQAKNALKSDPNLSLGYKFLGLAQFLAGDRETAAKSAADAVRLDPDDPYARYLRAYITTHQPDTMPTDASVEEDLQHAILLDQEFSPSYALLGRYLALRTSKLEEALALVNQAILFDPSNSRYQLALASVLAKMNKFDAARTAVSRAHALARDSSERRNAEAFTALLEKAAKTHGDAAAN